MTNAVRNEYETRDQILNLLSDAEVASVSTAETAKRLTEGDEYIDLEHLDQGVRKAMNASPPTGRVLSKAAVHAATWRKIMTQLDTLRGPTKH